MAKQKGLISGWGLKMFALFCMVIDHIGAFIPGMPFWMRYIGRLSAPVFFFLMVEAFFHTRNVGKYFLRLFGCGVLMQLGNEGMKYLFHNGPEITNNIFLGLAGCLLVIIFVDSFIKGKHRFVSFLCVVASMLFTLLTEAGLIGIACSLAFYCFHGHRGRLTLGYLIACLVSSAILPLMPAEYYWQVNPQWMMMFAIIPILFYNGKRGKDSTVTRWFFYLFYPLHIWLLYAIGQFIR